MSHNSFEGSGEFALVDYDNGLPFVPLLGGGVVSHWPKFIDKEAFSIAKLFGQDITGHTALLKRGDKPEGNITPLALCFRQYMGGTLSVGANAGTEVFAFANIVQSSIPANRFVQSINSALFGFGLIQSLIKGVESSPLNLKQFDSHLTRSLSGSTSTVNQNLLVRRR